MKTQELVGATSRRLEGVIKTLIICLGLILTTSLVFAQNNYDLSQFPSGTMTVSTLKIKYTTQEIRDMLDNVNILRNINDKSKFGFIFTNPTTFEKHLVCDADSTVVIFEYIIKLRQEIVTLKSRMQTAGIP